MNAGRRTLGTVGYTGLNYAVSREMCNFRRLPWVARTVFGRGEGEGGCVCAASTRGRGGGDGERRDLIPQFE